MLDVVQLGELAAVVGRDVLLELLEGLPAEVAAVHQEQDAAGVGELDQAVDRRDGRERLAAAGGHLDQGAGAVVGERVLQVADRPRSWAGQRPLRRQIGRHRSRRRACGAGGLSGNSAAQPGGQRLGPVEVEDAAAARLGVEPVGEAGLHAGALVQERQRAAVGREGVREARRCTWRPAISTPVRVVPAFFASIDPGGLAVDVEQVVGEAVARLEGELADRDPTGRVQVRLVSVLDGPAGLLKGGVDRLAGGVFGLRHGIQARHPASTIDPVCLT